MRIVVIDTNNLAAFSGLLDRQISGSALERIKILNPHVDFKNIVPGTVLLVPDTLQFGGGANSTITGDAFAALSTQMLASVDAVASRVLEAYETMLGEQKEVMAVLKSGTLKRSLKGESDLDQQIEAGIQVFKLDQQRAKDAAKTMQDLQEHAAAELAALKLALG